MTISYEYNRDKRYLLVKVLGELTLSDTLEYFEAIATDPDIDAPFFEIADLSGLSNFDFGYYQSELVISKLEMLRSKHHYQGSLFIIDRSYIRGMTNIFRTVGEERGLVVEGVASFDEAMVYINNFFLKIETTAELYGRARTN